MSTAVRPKATRMTVCDLCDTEIPDGQPDETGSLTAGYIAHRVETPKTKAVYFLWPPPSRKRRAKRGDDIRPRRYDFHAECILRLVETAVTARTAPTTETRESAGESES